MKVIYTAGPYSADGDNNVLNNILTARYIARTLWLRGWAVICPHTNNILMNGPDTTWELFMAGDLELLKRSDAIYMLPGWENSKGAKVEHGIARTLGLPIYYNLDEVPNEKG